MKWSFNDLAQVSTDALAQGADLSADITQNLLTTNNVWMMLSTALVFIMHLGFAGEIGRAHV